MTASGKIQKFKLREQFAPTNDRMDGAEMTGADRPAAPDSGTGH